MAPQRTPGEWDSAEGDSFVTSQRAGCGWLKGYKPVRPPDGGQGVAGEADKPGFMHEPIIMYGSSNQPERMSFKRNKFPLLR